MRARFLQTFLCLLLPVSLFAQQKGESFFLGSANFTAYSYSNFRTGSTGLANTDQTTNYGINVTIDYGRFIKDKKSLQYGLISGLNYNESNFIKINGANEYTWNYNAGAHIAYSNYYSLLPGLFATIRNDFAYTYAWSSGNDESESRTRTHTINYRLSPGLFYRATPKLAFTLSLDLLTVSLSHRSRSTDYAYNNIGLSMLANANVNSLNFGLLWFPFATKKQKRNDIQ